MAELEEIVEQQQYQIDKLYNVIADKQRKNKERRIKEYERSITKETVPFVKQYCGGWGEILELRKAKKLSYSDLGRFSLICIFLEKDTSLIVHPDSGLPMTKAQICKVIGDTKQHFSEDFQKLIDTNLIITNYDSNGKEIYFVNNEYNFNGYSRINVNYMIFNDCQFNDNTKVAQTMVGN